MKLQKGYFRLAKNVSKYSDCRVKIGAVISKKTPLSVGFNILTPHPKFIDFTTHAEMKAILNLGMFRDINGCDIYVYRETDDGIPALARPCDSCYNILRMYGIKKIYYTIRVPPYWKCERI